MTRLWAELVVLFVGLPAAIFFLINDLQIWLMPLLGLVGIVCLAVLLADNQFKRFRLWHTTDFLHHFKTALKLFIPWACLMMAAVYLIRPDLFLDWPLHQTGLWLTTLLIYPVVSVIPQEIIFRTFFFHRYKPIMPSKRWRWAVSTFLFGLAHLVYGNWVAVILSWCGGALFGYRYLQTRSTPVVVVEHTMWGCFIFTVGLGAWLIRAPGS